MPEAPRGREFSIPVHICSEAKERVDLYLYYPPLGLRGLLEEDFTFIIITIIIIIIITCIVPIQCI
jgi:hypothetical protein